jgi:hypothetical protein
VTVTSGVIIGALIAAVAVVSSGYPAQHLTLGDGSVWVANSQQQSVGRANPDVAELNSVVASTGSDLDVVQSGRTVLLFDHTGNKIDIVDPATSTVSDSVPLPPNGPQVFIAGSKAVILEKGTGQVWIVSLDQLAKFDAQSTPTLTLGPNAIMSVEPSGMAFAFAPSTSLLYRIDAAHSDVVQATQSLAVASTTAALSISSVGGRWAVLDSTANQLYLDSRIVDLSGLVGSGSGAVIQWPSDAGDRVLVGFSGGLISVPLSGAAAVGLVDKQAGSAARPLDLGNCEFAAWSNGTNWRRCPGDSGSGTTLALASMVGNARLAFAVNGDRAVLNDLRSGAAWAVQRTGELIDNWNALIPADNKPPQDQQNDQNVPPQVEKVEQPPVAVNDAFGARPGRSTVLPVLLNDYDPNGDVLVISDLAPIDATVGRIDLINQRQQVQLTLAAGATGAVRFKYTITDGRGGSASADVVVTVKRPGENSPPQQVRSTKLTVQAGGRATTQVLGDWVDPEGDPFFLTSAVVASPDKVSYKPQGTVVYSDSGKGSDLKIVTLTVSDGKAQGTGGLTLSVKQPGQVPIVAEPFVMLAYAGQEITVAPLDHVRGGTGTIRLNSVPSKPDTTITPSYGAGTFRFSSSVSRSNYVEYVVTDGAQTVTGLVRIDVAPPPDANTKPITVPKTVFVRTLRSERVDVAGTDVDPAGGVLVVTGVSGLSSASGVRAEILEQRLIRVSLDKPLDGVPVTFNYKLTNGLAEATGTITVIEIPAPARVQPPIANDDSVTVRVGQVIDIPVLANDEQPDGLDLTLQPVLDQELPAGSGLLFASGSVLRYLAPNKTGNFTAAYRVTGPDGQAATGLVRIAVRESDLATNNAPVPATVTARAIAGQTVKITIPLSGIDPDGDSVQLLGQSSNPEKGSIIDQQADSITYQAGDYSSGTDTFTYSVIDSLGARATGTIRVGISPRLDGARNPVANVDQVTVRPGVTVSVQVLANDSDPGGSPLKIVSVTPNDSVTTAVVQGDFVNVTPPRDPGTYGVIYTIENDSGGSSRNFIRVKVDPNAPRAQPVASDSVLTLSDIQGRDRVAVDVLANVFFADGDERSLGVSVYPGYESAAQVLANKNIEVTVGKKSQIIPFKVTNPDDPTIFQYAFIRVPGTDDALPQLDRRAPALVVTSEEKLVIDLNSYVIAASGKQVRLTDSGTVQATHANGDALVRDDRTLVYSSAKNYFGPASISFQVTDGASATDPTGKTAILVLPITVEPRDNQPPSFNGANIEFEPGQEKIIDLLKLTNYPYPNDLDQLLYSILAPLPQGFISTLSGSLLTLRANDDAVKGSTTSMSIAVRDNKSSGQPGRIDLTVVPSTRPLVQPADDAAIIKRGSSATIDVLANDEATNPFPGKPLTVVDIRGLAGAALPAGVEIVPSADKSSLTATIAATAAPGVVSLQYQVADSTKDASRFVWGTVTISIQDRPDPVSNLFPTSFGDRTVTMRWNAGSFNNSPITNYRVIASRGGSVIDTENCTGTTCTIATAGNGPGNAVTVTVIATNSIGDSDPVATASESIWSDIIPPAPTGFTSAPLDHGLLITWQAVSTPGGGSPVDRYRIQVGANSGDFSPGICTGGTCQFDTTAAGWNLDNGVAVSYTVSARNGALPALSAWNSSDPRSDVPAGAPIARAAPVATALTDTAVQLDFSGAFLANGRPISTFSAAAYTGIAPTCASDGTITDNGATVQNVGTSTATQFSGLSPNAEYSLIAFAFNGQGCTASQAVLAHTPPPAITGLTFDVVPNGSQFDIVITGGTIGGAPLTADYSIIYQLSGGSVQGGERGPVAVGAPLMADGTQYGQPISVQARACRTWGSVAVCQPDLSGAFDTGLVPVDPSVSSLTFTPASTVPGVGDGAFDWLGWPSGVGYQSIRYTCDGQPGFVNADTTQPGHCDATGASPVTLTIRVIANGGQTYDITYPSN